MSALAFLKLNEDWNAEPNAPRPLVRQEGNDVLLEFYLNKFKHKAARGKATLCFRDVSKYRLGATNDEGWYRGQCRYSKIAPRWGEFYELNGDDPNASTPSDWKFAEGDGTRHFLFYLRDETFEAFARDWALASHD